MGIISFFERLSYVKARRANFEKIRKELDKVGKEFERKNYSDLLSSANNLSTEIVVDGHVITLSAEAYAVKENGDVCFCIDARSVDMPTMFSIYPSYQFFKRKDGTVYY